MYLVSEDPMDRSFVTFVIKTILTKLKQNTSGEPSICQYCKMSMMQNDIDAKCQQSRYVNVAKCQSLSNASNKNRGHRSQ